MSYAVIGLKEKRGLGLINVDEILDEVTINIPKFKEKKDKKYAKKVVKVLKKYRVSNVVLSQELQDLEDFKNILYENNNYIITGRRLYKVLILKILKDISEQMSISLQTMNVSLLVDEYSIENLDLIEHIAKEVKSLTIVTNNINRFQKLYETLFEKYGITLKILEKGRTNIKRCNFIINIDFTEEEMKALDIFRNSVVISVNEKIKSLRKNFNGIIINDIDIYIKKEIKNYRTLPLCEAYMYNYLKKIKDNEKIFEKSEYDINGYYGNNGKIVGEDFKRVGLLLKNKK